jgi:hypothetical protein
VKVQGQLDKFKSQRYLKWKDDLQMFLGMNNLSHLTQPLLNNQTLEERERRDREEEKIIEMIYFSVSDLYQYIVKEWIV